MHAWFFFSFDNQSTAGIVLLYTLKFLLSPVLSYEPQGGFLSALCFVILVAELKGWTLNY